MPRSPAIAPLSPSERHRRAMLADSGLRAIRERQAAHDALCGPIIDRYRREGSSWGEIAGLMNLSHEPPATARGMATAAPWTRAAVRRIWLRWTATHPEPARCTKTMELAL